MPAQHVYTHHRAERILIAHLYHAVHLFGNICIDLSLFLGHYFNLSTFVILICCTKGQIFLESDPFYQSMFSEDSLMDLIQHNLSTFTHTCEAYACGKEHYH